MQQLNPFAALNLIFNFKEAMTNVEEHSAYETEALQRISQGKSYTRIAAGLFVSKDTVHSHIKNIYLS